MCKKKERKKETCQVNADILTTQFKIIKSFNFYEHSTFQCQSVILCAGVYIYIHRHWETRIHFTFILILLLHKRERISVNAKLLLIYYILLFFCDLKIHLTVASMWLFNICIYLITSIYNLIIYLNLQSIFISLTHSWILCSYINVQVYSDNNLLCSVSVSVLRSVFPI